MPASSGSSMPGRPIVPPVVDSNRFAMLGMSTTRKKATSASDQSLNRMPGRPVTSPSRSDTATATGTATSSSLHPVRVEDGGGVGAAGEDRHLTEGKLTAVAEADVEAGDDHGVDRGEQDLTLAVRPDQAERRQGGDDRGDGRAAGSIRTGGAALPDRPSHRPQVPHAEQAGGPGDEHDDEERRRSGSAPSPRRGSGRRTPPRSRRGSRRRAAPAKLPKPPMAAAANGEHDQAERAVDRDAGLGADDQADEA